MVTQYFIIIYTESCGFELGENSKQIRKYSELHIKLSSVIVPHTHARSLDHFQVNHPSYLYHFIQMGLPSS